MSRCKLSSLVAATALAVAFVLAAPTRLTSQSDCNTSCYDGKFDYVRLICNSGAAIDCTHCNVTCPGGGGDGPPPVNRG